MEFIDTHCHLEAFVRRGELDAVLARASQADVSRMIAIGTSIKDWPLYLNLARKYRHRIFHTVGLHPTSVEEDWNDQVTQIAPHFADDPAPVALGEIGLDHFHLPQFPDEAAEVRQRQEAAFIRQLELALQFDCPVVIHSRNAFGRTVELIDEAGLDWGKVVFHCFAEDAAGMRALTERGGRGSFTGIVTYPKSGDIREAVRAQDLDSLMIETDAPYLAPQAHRGKGNEPAFLRDTGEYLAGLFGLPLEEFAAQTTLNAETFFGIRL